MRFLFLFLLLPNMLNAMKTEVYAWLKWRYSAEQSLRRSYPESYTKCDWIIGREWGWRPLLILDLIKTVKLRNLLNMIALPVK